MQKQTPGNTPDCAGPAVSSLHTRADLRMKAPWGPSPPDPGVHMTHTRTHTLAAAQPPGILFPSGTFHDQTPNPRALEQEGLSNLHVPSFLF